MTVSAPLTVFVSYSHDSDTHATWVQKLADALEEMPAFHVIFDRYDLRPGMDLTNFMDRSAKSDRIVVVITPEYVRKATRRIGGVGYETSIISADVLANQLADRVVPIVRSGMQQPVFLQSKVYVNFADETRFGAALRELRDALLQVPRATRPPKRNGDDIPASAESEPDATLPTDRAAFDALRKAITDGTPTRKIVARHYWQSFIRRLFAMAPYPPPMDDDSLVGSLSRTTPLVVEFAKACEAIAAVGDEITALTLYVGFGEILARYDVNPSSTVRLDRGFDFYRFIGHELFVCLIASLLQERQFGLLKKLLEEDIDTRSSDRNRLRPFHEMQRGTYLLFDRSKRLNLMSAHGALLRERHASSDLGAVMPFEQVLGADYFLFLFAEAHHQNKDAVPWFPPTAPYLTEGSTFLARLRRVAYATEVATTFDLTGIDDLRRLIANSEVKLARAFGIDWYRIPEAYDPSVIGAQ